MAHLNMIYDGLLIKLWFSSSQTVKEPEAIPGAQTYDKTRHPVDLQHFLLLVPAMKTTPCIGQRFCRTNVKVLHTSIC